MNRNEAITGLVNYALEKKFIQTEEKNWAVNMLLDILKVDSFEWAETQQRGKADLTEWLGVLLDDAYERGILENYGQNLRRKPQIGIISLVRIRIILEKTGLQEIFVGRPTRNMENWILQSTSLSRKKTLRLLQRQECCHLRIIHAVCFVRKIWDMQDG